MLERLLMSGSGGQGVILAGKVLATAAVKTIRHVTFFPDYGAEVRGGTSKCQVVLSSEEIASPVSDVFESLVVMNQESLDCFLSIVPANGLVLINSSLCRMPEDDPHGCIGIAATEIADRLGSVRAANFVMLGAYARHRPCVPPASIEKCMRDVLSGKGRDEMAGLNVKAFQEGMNA
jgi:2-oxoglutarate ferredoxin oxidoreductase subunit gamma